MRNARSHIAALLLGLTVALVAAAAWETLWRSRGYEPALADDRDLWAQHRKRSVSIDQQRNVTVIGASRIQLAFSTAAFERHQPGWQAVSLAINGNYPVAVLQDLAADERFAGVVLCAIDARGLAHWYRDMSEPWVRHYQREFGPQRRLERRLLSSLQQRLVAAGSDFNLIRRTAGWLDGQPPFRHYTRLLPDRTIAADYALADVPALRAGFAAALAADYRKHPAPDPQRWLDDLEPVLAAVDRIRVRGGQVVFLRMPTAGEHYRLDRENYPRELYWDRFAARTGAVTVHFADWPQLAALELPDTSHIDRSDRDRFAEVLVGILRENDVLPEPGN